MKILERAKGFEPSTSTLARLRSTPELRPLSVDSIGVIEQSYLGMVTESTYRTTKCDCIIYFCIIKAMPSLIRILILNLFLILVLDPPISYKLTVDKELYSHINNIYLNQDPNVHQLLEAAIV